MQLNWAEEHSRALREYLAKGLTFSQIADALNARFNTDYSRNAAIGRARRMGLSGPAKPDRPARPPKRQPKARAPGAKKPQSRVPAAPRSRLQVLKRAAALKLRCVGIVPRHLALIDLEVGDCRYPYGGDEEGEPITFCGHPRREGSSYCTSHFHLTIKPDVMPERTAGRAPLRLVEAA
ncbi:MAG TPA: GcrA family cell cycle regulator [Bradyrhizobium sp.]|nr:GcrA family cell cycle regulator [Bradyrhizobium sp.]